MTGILLTAKLGLENSFVGVQEKELSGLETQYSVLSSKA